MYPRFLDALMFDRRNYESRKVADKIEKYGLVVSTAYTTDEGYETAIGDLTGEFYPVERYETKEEAIKGHTSWGNKLKGLKTVYHLGDSEGYVESETVSLVRTQDAD